MTDTPVFQNVAILGSGLIGSSLARAITARFPATDIHLHDPDAKVRAVATRLDLGVMHDTAGAAVATADLVVFCMPVGAIAEAAADIASDLPGTALVTDVGSVKTRVRDALTAALPGHARIIPGHPIAGTEKSGPEAGFADLFKGRWCILTPPDETSDGLADLTAFWEGLGSRVEMMTPEHHDRVLAITSHLPHLIAFNIVGTASDLEAVTESEVVKFSAGGFRDFTRIAASDPVMWRDVFLNNRDAVLEMLGRFTEDLTALQRAIRWEDGEALAACFTRARGVRRSVIDAGQDTDAANFGRDES